MRILIDENLSPDLAAVGNQRGYFTTSTRDLGLLGRKDFQLVPYCIENDYVIMTIDAGDPKDIAEASGLHPGLILLEGGGNYEHMIQMATAALDHIDHEAAAAGEDSAAFMANKAVEVALDGSCHHYDLP